MTTANYQFSPEIPAYPVVPNEVQHLVDDHFMGVYDAWQHRSLDNVIRNMPDTQAISLDNGTTVRAVDLGPKTEDAIGLWLPYGQAWKPSMYIRAEILRQVVGPNNRLVVFANNSVVDRAYDLNKDELKKVSSGDFSPIAERHVRAIEALGVSSLWATGYSQGALLAPRIAAVGSDKFDVIALNSDEAPRTPRSPKVLRKDFMASGGWKEQNVSIEQSGIPVLQDALNGPRLALDYTRFALAALKACNRAMHEGMAHGDLLSSLTTAQRRYPDMHVKIGRVLGSVVAVTEDTDVDLLEVFFRDSNQVTVKNYSDNGVKHTLGDNPFAHALLAKDGLAA